MTPEGLSIAPTATPDEAAAIAAAVRASTRRDRGEASGDGDVTDRPWGFAARIEAVQNESSRFPDRGTTSPWRALTRPGD